MRSGSGFRGEGPTGQQPAKVPDHVCAATSTLSAGAWILDLVLTQRAAPWLSLSTSRFLADVRVIVYLALLRRFEMAKRQEPPEIGGLPGDARVLSTRDGLRVTRERVEGLLTGEGPWRLMEPASGYDAKAGTHGQQFLALTSVAGVGPILKLFAKGLELPSISSFLMASLRDDDEALSQRALCPTAPFVLFTNFYRRRCRFDPRRT